jgi:hypothetical protein
VAYGTYTASDLISPPSSFISSSDSVADEDDGILFETSWGFPSFLFALEADGRAGGQKKAEGDVPDAPVGCEAVTRPRRETERSTVGVIYVSILALRGCRTEAEAAGRAWGYGTSSPMLLDDIAGAAAVPPKEKGSDVFNEDAGKPAAIPLSKCAAP